MKNRNTNGTFTVGNSLGGRKKGAVDKYAKYKKLAEPDMPKLVKKLMDMALEGDLVAAKIILDRTWSIQGAQVAEMQTQLDELSEILESRKLKVAS